MSRKGYNRVYKRYKKYDRIITKVNKKHNLSEQMRVVLMPSKTYKEFQEFISDKNGYANIWKALGYTDREIMDNIGLKLYRAIKDDIESRANAKQMRIELSDIYFFFIEIIKKYNK